MYIYICIICILYVYTAHTDSAYIISETQSTPTKHTDPHYWTHTPQNLAHNQCFFPKIEPKKTGRIWVLVNDTHNHSLSPIIINYLHTSTSDWLHWLVSETSKLCMDRYRYRIIWYAGYIGFQVELSGRMGFAENHQVYKSKCRVKNCHCQCMGMVQNCVPQKMDGEILSN